MTTTIHFHHASPTLRFLFWSLSHYALSVFRLESDYETDEEEIQIKVTDKEEHGKAGKEDLFKLEV